jgi:hypothetical protein
MTSKQLFYSIAGTLLVSSLVVTPFVVNTSAQVDNENLSEKTQHKGRIRKNRDVFEAVRNEDYTAWSEAVAETGRGEYMLERIDENSFPTYIEMIEAYRNDDIETGDALALELDLPTKAEREEFRSAMREAYKNKDYNAYLELVTNTEDFPEDKILTEEEFNERADNISNFREKRKERRAERN